LYSVPLSFLCSREGSIDFYVRIAAPIPLFPPFYAFISNPLTPLHCSSRLDRN